MAASDDEEEHDDLLRQYPRGNKRAPADYRIKYLHTKKQLKDTFKLLELKRKHDSEATNSEEEKAGDIGESASSHSSNKGKQQKTSAARTKKERRKSTDPEASMESDTLLELSKTTLGQSIDVDSGSHSERC